MFEFPLLAGSVLLSTQIESGFWISRLNHEEFRVRQQAHDQLAARILESDGYLLALQLEHVALSSCPEAARRARLLLAQFYWLEPTSYLVMPWIDMLPEDWPERKAVIETYLGRARQLLDTSYYRADWPDYRLATTLYVSDLLRQGMPRLMVQRLLDAMVEREIAYRQSRGMPPLVKDYCPAP
ncbi:MAG: hypothetical protein RMI91_02890 [Gemmatales bacterium]|nr:hypothetical protein [Gemmatales bacterium]MDW7993575.1 hypothetical protein [Gemmatales bacterium]